MPRQHSFVQNAALAPSRPLASAARSGDPGGAEDAAAGGFGVSGNMARVRGDGGPCQDSRSRIIFL